MSDSTSVFWDDLQEDLKDPEFLREYVTQYLRIRTIDQLINQLDELRSASHMTKAELARSLNAEPANMRRLLTGKQQNPAVGTIAEVAAALGYKLTLEPLSEDEKQVTTLPLRSGKTSDAKRLVNELVRPTAASVS